MRTLGVASAERARWARAATALGLCLAFTAPGLAGSDGRHGTILVESGQPRAVRAAGCRWTAGDDCLRIEGRECSLVADPAIGGGDVLIRARLRVLGLDRGGASFSIGGITFGFSNLYGEMTILGAPGIRGTIRLGPTLITEARTFDFEVTREGERLAYAIDGARLRTITVRGRRLGDMAFTGGSGGMEIESWVVEGETLPSTFREERPPYEATIFAAGDDGGATYRIPVLVSAPGGALLALAERRPSHGGDRGDIDLVVRRSVDLGESWSDPATLAGDGDSTSTFGNPCAVVDHETDVVWVLFCRNNERVLVISSADDGLSWTHPRDITADARDTAWTWVATGPGTGVQLERGARAGRLIVTAHHSRSPEAHRGGYVEGVAHVIFSDDHGTSWRAGGSLGIGLTEGAIVELTDGRLMLNLRNHRHHGRRAIALSQDGGLTWPETHVDRVLVDPVCQASLIRYPGGPGAPGPLIFANPASSTGRTGMTIRVSRDEGLSWPHDRVIHAGPAAYSSLAVLADGSIGALYESGLRTPYEGITFARLSLEWLIGPADQPAGPED